MRHNKKKFTLGRTRNPRRALARALAESLIIHGNIKTTLAKAKALRTIIEPLITKAKKKTLFARREALKVLYTEKAVKKLFAEVAPKYQERRGGYTRIVKLASRAHDAAKMARIELV